MNTPKKKSAIGRVLDESYQRGLAGFVLLGAAIADQQLEDAILTKMRHLSRKQRDELFSGYGPLSSLSAKISMAYALSLVDAKTRDRLHGLRRVRNKFAHADDFVTFQHPDIKSLMSKLPLDCYTDLKNEHLYMWHLGQVESHLVATAGPQIQRPSPANKTEA